MLRDLGSSNGTFVNGKRVIGQQALKARRRADRGRGDAPGGQARPAASAVPRQPRSPSPRPATPPSSRPIAADVDDEDEEFEMEFDDGEPVPEVEGIPLADDETVEAGQAQSAAVQGRVQRSHDSSRRQAEKAATPKPKAGKEDDAIAHFLLDLKTRRRASNRLCRSVLMLSSGTIARSSVGPATAVRCYFRRI